MGGGSSRKKGYEVAPMVPRIENHIPRSERDFTPFSSIFVGLEEDYFGNLKGKGGSKPVSDND